MSHRNYLPQKMYGGNQPTSTIMQWEKICAIKNTNKKPRIVFCFYFLYILAWRFGGSHDERRQKPLNSTIFLKMLRSQQNKKMCLRKLFLQSKNFFRFLVLIQCFLTTATKCLSIKKNRPIFLPNTNQWHCRAYRHYENSLHNYFPDVDVNQFAVVSNPFSTSLEGLENNDFAQEELLNLKKDSGATDVFRSATLNAFWCQIYQSYSQLSKTAVKLLMPYPSIYLSEQAFSTIVVVKTKYRNRVHVESDMLVALSDTEPRVKFLVDNKQAYPSHLV